MLKKFILKISILLFPVILLHLFTYLYYVPDKGDLLRVGYIIDKFPEYRKIFAKEFSYEMKVIPITQVSKKKKYDLLTIGDSFSEQKNSGYQNFLALKKELNVVHIDRYFHKNQFQILIGLLNSGFFDRYKFKYVLVQFVEAGSRDFAFNLDYDYIFHEKKFLDLEKPDENKYKSKFVFLSDRIVKFPYFNLKRILFPNLPFNEVYSLPLKSQVFSVNDFTLYFHSSNPPTSNNNSEESVRKLNSFLNKLALELKAKDVKLIILPVPDKLDFYFNQLQYSGNFERVRFFELMKPLEKKYLYLDTFELLKNIGEDKKDVYFYDDTHWSPVAVEPLANEISALMEESINK